MSFPVLAPAGTVGIAERSLMLHTVELMLIVVIPVFALAIYVAWHWRASNTSATYKPRREQSKMEEFIWWVIPFEIVLVLSALTWTSTHQLDPAKALASTEPPLKIQVVALPWKWLFIYPDQGVALVGNPELQVNRPVEFDITADAPMNSLWIPALGGQIYAMTGMVTKLNLLPTQIGVYHGGSANYSGDGFSTMQFYAQVLSQADFDRWAAAVKQSPSKLTATEFNRLAKASVGDRDLYSTVSPNLFDTIVMQFMPADSMSGMHM